MQGRIARQEFTLEDLRDQLRQLRKMGPLGQLMDLLPKAGPFKNLDMKNGVDESSPGGGRGVDRFDDASGAQEGPGLLNASRKKRVAKGSGRSIQELNQLLRQYKQMRKMMKRMKGDWMKGALGGMPPGGGLPPGLGGR